MTAEILMWAAPFALGFAGWVVKKWIQDIVSQMSKMTTTIDERTRPIQKDANGGFSLPDAIRKLEKIDNKTDNINERITELATDVAHLKGRFDQHMKEGSH